MLRFINVSQVLRQLGPLDQGIPEISRAPRKDPKITDPLIVPLEVIISGMPKSWGVTLLYFVCYTLILLPTSL
jgi:hypothetical protein